MRRPLRAVSSLVAVLACTSTSESQTGVDGTAEVRPEAPPPAAAPREPEPPPALHAVAYAKPAITLTSWDGRAYVLVNGQLGELHGGHRPALDPSASADLFADFGKRRIRPDLVAFGGTVMTMAANSSRTNFRIVEFALGPSGWVERDRDDPGVVETYVGAYLQTRAGALLGLRRFTIRGPGPFSSHRPRTHPGFTVLAGPRSNSPQLPKGWDASAVVSTDSGEIVALGYQTRESADGHPHVLTWAPGHSEPTITELPDTEAMAHDQLGLWPAGDDLIVGGDIDSAPPYLALREHGAWRVLALGLAGDQAPSRVRAAARTAKGELWVVGGAAHGAQEQPCGCLWRKPRTGDWALVELEPVDYFDAASKIYPAARDVVWGSGALWITAVAESMGESSWSSTGVWRRTILYANYDAGAPIELPP